MNTEDSRPYDEQDIVSLGKAFKDGTAIAAGRALAFFASFAVVSAMGAFVSRETAGEYAIILATLPIVSIFTLPGMQSALVRAIARGENGAVGGTMRLRLLYGSAGAAIAAIIGLAILASGNRSLGLGFIAAAPFVPLTDTFSNAAFGYWNGKKRFLKTARLTVAYYFGIAFFSIPAMMLSDSLPVIVLIVMIGQTSMGLFAYRTIPKEHCNNRLADTGTVQLGMHLTAMQICATVAANADRIIAGYLLGPASTAIYTFAVSPVLKARQLIPVGVVSLPYLSAHTLTQHTKKALLRKTARLFLIGIPVIGLGLAIAPFAYKVFFPAYPDSVTYFRILALQLALMPVALLRAALTAFAKTKALYVIEIASPVAKIALLIAGGISGGLTGLAYASLAAATVDAAIVVVMFKHIKE